MKKTVLKLIITIIIIIIVFPFILYFGSKLYNKKYHSFWSQQPVSFYYTLKISNGILSSSRPPPAIKDDNYSLEHFSPKDDKIEEIINLMNKNYSITPNCSYHYDKEYLDWMFNNENKERINLHLSDNNNIIGCISARPITIILKKAKLRCLYVDNLCVEKNYRSKGLAPILISNMSNHGFDKGYNLFIFQKEGYQLPFRSITVAENMIYQLHKYNLGKYELSTLDDNNLKQVYDFYNNYYQNKDNYIEYSFTEFNHYFKNQWVTTFVEFKNNQIINLVVTQDNKYQIDGQKVIEIPYMIIKSDPNNQFVKKIINQCLDDGYKLICNKNQDNKHYFSELKKSNTFNTFIYMYNYHLVSPINNNNLFFF